MAVGDVIQYNQLKNWYDTVNSKRSLFGSGAAALTLPGQGSTVQAAHINNLKSSLDYFKNNDTYLKTIQSMYAAYSGVSVGEIIRWNTAAPYDTTRTNLINDALYKNSNTNSNGVKSNVAHGNGSNSNGDHTNGAKSNGSHTNGSHGNGNSTCWNGWDGGAFGGCFEGKNNGNTNGNGSFTNGAHGNGNNTNGANTNGTKTNGANNNAYNGNGSVINIKTKA